MRKVNALSAVVAVLITAGLSGVVASNAASTPTIYACVSKTSSLTKVSTKPHACPKGTLKLSWGITGTKGATGTRGAQGAQGPYGPEGAAGPAGAQGPAGSDGGGVTIYTGQQFQNTIVKPYSGTSTDYTIIATNSVLPEGTYFVTATTSFRNTPAPEVAECFVYLDAAGRTPWNNGASIFSDIGTQVNMAISGTFDVPATGARISLGCHGGNGATAYESRITALKVVSINPSN